MIVFRSLDELNMVCKTSVALGNFDGIHVGHQRIMKEAISYAKESGMKSLCFTFSNHPVDFIMQRADDNPNTIKLICSEDEKIRLIGEMGFDLLVNVPFDEAVMSMKAEDFFSDVIIGKLNAGSVSVGFNYSYGAKAGGNANTLEKECEDAGIAVRIHDAVRVDNEIVSSTLIREMIGIGNMELAARYLGRPYAFKGRVTHGKKLGSAMGIPTVNIDAPSDILLPPNGVYFSRILIDGKEYNSVSNLGVKPTIEDFTADNKENDGAPTACKSLETNIFDFNDDAYGKDITIYLDHFSRSERKFANKEELFAQIAKDCESAKEYHQQRTKI